MLITKKMLLALTLVGALAGAGIGALITHSAQNARTRPTSRKPLGSRSSVHRQNRLRTNRVSTKATTRALARETTMEAIRPPSQTVMPLIGQRLSDAIQAAAAECITITGLLRAAEASGKNTAINLPSRWAQAQARFSAA